MEKIITFNQKLGENWNIAGSKASNLWKIRGLDVKIPNSLVVSTSVFSEYLEKNNLQAGIKERLNRIMSEEEIDYNKESNFLKKLFKYQLSNNLVRDINDNLKKFNAKTFVIRSSATLEDLASYSFAGIYDSFLNVSIENIPKYILKCWASLFSPRSLFYRKHYNLTDMGYMAVLIQELIKADFSGVMFTSDPIDKENILIEIVKGYGQKLVGGEIIPLSCRILRSNLPITDTWSDIIIKDYGANNVEIKDEIIIELANTGFKIESYFRKKQDIEFCIKDSKVLILQTRNITTD